MSGKRRAANRREATSASGAVERCERRGGCSGRRRKRRKVGGRCPERERERERHREIERKREGEREQHPHSVTTLTALSRWSFPCSSRGDHDLKPKRERHTHNYKKERMQERMGCRSRDEDEI